MFILRDVRSCEHRISAIYNINIKVMCICICIVKI